MFASSRKPSFAASPGDMWIPTCCWAAGGKCSSAIYKLEHLSSRRFWSPAGRGHGFVFFVLTVPCAGLRTHEFYTQKMLTDGLIQGTGPMPLFSLVTGHGKAWQLLQSSSHSSQLFSGSAHTMRAWSCRPLLLSGQTTLFLQGQPPAELLTQGLCPSHLPYSALLSRPYLSAGLCFGLSSKNLEKIEQPRSSMGM